MGKGGSAGQRGGGAEAVALRQGTHRGGLNPITASSPRFAQGDIGEWLLWTDHTPRPGWANMAIDHALLERAGRHGESWLRLYQWTPHCLSFGRNEPATRRYDLRRIMELGLDTVRRPTGGRAVWHAEELTYAVAAPTARFGSLRAAYLEIHGMLADALQGLGARATLAPPVRAVPLDSGPCFSQPAGGEIMIAGRKVVGSAQVRQGNALLQHGSILLQENQSILFGLMRGPIIAQSPQPTEDSTRNLYPPQQGAEIADAIRVSAGTRWPGEWNPAPDVEPALHGATAHFPHYRSAEWTWAR